MARSANYVWPLPATAAIAALQTKGSAGNLILNGSLNITGVQQIIELAGVCRTVTLTSAANLSGLTFIVSGTYLGLPVSESLAGPNINTVETSQLFHTITGVSVSATTGASTVSVGTGASGHTLPYRVNEHATVCALSAHVVVTSGAGDLTYSFYSSLQEMDADFSIDNGDRTMYNMRGTTATVTIGSHGMLAITGTGSTPPDYDIPVYGQTPVKWCWITVTNTLADPASMRAYILQQGIT